MTTLVTNLADHEVEFQDISVAGDGSARAGEWRTAAAGATVEVSDATAHGVPDQGFGGLLDQAANWKAADTPPSRVVDGTATAELGGAEPVATEA